MVQNEKEMNMIFLKRKPASFFEKKQAKVLETIQSLVSKIDVGEIVSVSKGYGGFTVTTPDGRCIKKVEAIKLDLIKKDMSELYIPPERFERDFITGRFLKGCVSHNKGRKMVYHSKRSKARSIKNLSKGRGSWHKTGAGMNKKSVVLIKDEKLCGVFPSIQMAGKMIGVAPSLISAICRKVRGKHTANGYRCFFEDSNDWYNLIKQDYE